ncbi:28356_t:CDS:2, partial [Gigaspora margarita]
PSTKRRRFSSYNSDMKKNIENTNTNKIYANYLSHRSLQVLLQQNLFPLQSELFVHAGGSILD